MTADQTTMTNGTAPTTPNGNSPNGHNSPSLLGDKAAAEAAKDSEGPELEKRETWSNKIQFLLGCMGFSVGLGNVWRFPYLCYADGGGAFLIPYTICVLLGAIPMFVLEIAIGQYTSQGAITCWDLVPILKGVGYATQLVLFLHNIYYNVIMGWGFYYLFASFTKVLPWSNCDNPWNTELCRKASYAYMNLNQTVRDYIGNYSVMMEDDRTPEATELYDVYLEDIKDSLGGKNITSVDIMMINGSVKAVDPVTEYWQRKVLEISSGVGELGIVKWDLALCLLLAWIVVYFCIWKGIKWTGKIMYVSTTSPYVFMLILLIRGVTLPGAVNGIKYYLYPDISKLTQAKVWYDAASQVFFSYSMCVGSLTALGSYNKFHHNFFKDSLLFALINSGTSFLAGFIIFAVLGFMSHIHQVGIDQVAESGPGLAFIAYPKAVAELPGAPVWSILFFIMLILLGMDSQFGCVEGFVTAIIDLYPRHLRRKFAREIFVAIICFVSFLLGLTMCTNGGMYVFLLFDNYCQARIILIIAFFECIAVSWVYGAAKFHENMELMLGRRLWPHLKICWLVITPLFNLFMSVLCFYNYSDVTYNRTYTYPKWAIWCGWLMSFSSVALIPIVMIAKIIMAEGTLYERVRYLMNSQIPPRKGDLDEDYDDDDPKRPKNGDINQVSMGLLPKESTDPTAV